MEDRAHAVVAIAFLLLLGCGAIFFIWWMRSGTPEVKTYDILSPYSVVGLAVDARVLYKGVEVGSVREIELDPKDRHKVLIRVTLVAKAPVTHGTYAEVSKAGITGMSYIALRDGSGSEVPLETSDQNPAKIPIHQNLISKLETSGETVLKQADELGKRLNDLLGAQNRAQVVSVLTNLNAATNQLLALEKAAMPTLQALPGLAMQTKQTLVQSQVLLKSVQRDSESFKVLTGTLSDIAQQVHEETLPGIDRLTRNLDRTTRSVDRLARELRRNPQSVLFGGPGPQPGPGEPGFHPPTEGYER
ncbi:MAG: MlaD family protein [Chromatiaceae bacterium]|jgi:phospholipid/cholesterol/gamma-HCH transport system substrate-binding protein